MPPKWERGERRYTTPPPTSFQMPCGEQSARDEAELVHAINAVERCRGEKEEGRITMRGEDDLGVHPRERGEEEAKQARSRQGQRRKHVVGVATLGRFMGGDPDEIHKILPHKVALS